MSEECPVILITGASRGLGRGIAEVCAAAGWSVAVHYAGNQAAAEATLASCSAKAPNKNQRFAIVRGNLAIPAERNAILEQTLAQLGRLDALVNNAGMAPRVRADLETMSEESFDEVLGVNLKGPFFLSQAVTRHWLAHPGKSLLPGGYKMLFITSVSANTVSINRGEYCISKAGLAMTAQLFAARLASDAVQVYEIRPGIMETDMTSGVKEKYDRLIAEGLVPQKRWGQPEDVGRAVKALIEGAFGYSTGNVVYVDGGMNIRRL